MIEINIIEKFQQNFHPVYRQKKEEEKLTNCAEVALIKWKIYSNMIYISWHNVPLGIMTYQPTAGLTTIWIETEIDDYPALRADL